MYVIKNERTSRRNQTLDGFLKKVTLILVLFTLFCICCNLYNYNKDVQNATVKEGKVIDMGHIEHTITHESNSKRRRKRTRTNGYYKIVWYQKLIVEYSIKDKKYRNELAMEVDSQECNTMPEKVSDGIPSKYQIGDKIELYVSKDDNNNICVKSSTDDTINGNNQVIWILFIVTCISGTLYIIVKKKVDKKKDEETLL